MEKIYTVQSRFKEFGSEREVSFHWWVSDREFPIIPYEQGITSHAELPRDERHDLECTIDDHFKKWEADALKDFLDRTFGSRFKTEIAEVSLPNDFSQCTQFWSGFSEYEEDSQTFSLSDEDDYDLPFEV
jgi:hypothetical protein